MKKSSLAILLLQCGIASAQSSVTLFGVVDATLARGTGSLSDRTQMTNSGNSSSRIGFRGVEDLGGGSSASFWLEAGVNNQDGRGAATNTNNQASGTGPSLGGGQGLTFNRRSTVSLSGNWGELRVGRDYTPHFWNLTLYDPYGTVGVGANQIIGSGLGGTTAVRASNSVGYLTPANLGGFFGQVQAYLGGNPSGTPTHNDGTGASGRLGWANEHFNVAIAIGKTRFATGDITVRNAGAEWDLGALRLMGQLAHDEVGGATSVTGRGYLAGAIYSIGPGDIKVALSDYRTTAPGNPSTTKFAIGYVHNLSKRTALYSTYAHVRNRGSASFGLNGATTASGQPSSGLDIGLRHIF